MEKLKGRKVGCRGGRSCLFFLSAMVSESRSPWLYEETDLFDCLELLAKLLFATACLFVNFATVLQGFGIENLRMEM